jgi:poly(A) polymerase
VSDSPPTAAVPVPVQPGEALPGVPAALRAELLAAAAPDRLALVGGAVRDLLLHREHNDPWRGVPDLDLVVEPAEPRAETAAAHRLARRLQRRLGPEGVPACQEHGAYGTVELELSTAAGPLLLDVASARCEEYPEPGENPLVRFGQLADDLARRDFTINAMALLFTPEAVRLLDPHGGRADLARRQLRLLHGASLRDDPTRIVRGARYAARLGFELAGEARQQLHATLAAWPWRWRPGDPPDQAPAALATRLRMELELLLERENWRAALAALQGWGALPLLDPGLQADRGWRRRLVWAARLELPLLPALLAGAADPLALAARLQLPQRQQRLLAGWLALRRRLASLGPEAAGWDPARWCALFEAPGCSPAMVALALAAGDGPRRPLLRWWWRWRHLGPPCSAAELIAAGTPPGPALGARLRQLRAERLAAERR